MSISSGAGRKSVLIAGPTDSGKTVLFGRLAYKKQVETFTSMGENIGEFSTVTSDNTSSGKRLNLVDLPGNLLLLGLVCGDASTKKSS